MADDMTIENDYRTDLEKIIGLYIELIHAVSMGGDSPPTASRDAPPTKRPFTNLSGESFGVIIRLEKELHLQAERYGATFPAPDRKDAMRIRKR